MGRILSYLVAITLTGCVVGTLAQDIPPCLSTCMTPFPGNHEPDTCSANWTATISACIDRACSVSIASQDDTTRTTMFLAPGRGLCQGVGVPGADSGSPSLQLQPGVCAQSPYAFLSFFLSNGQNAMAETCSLHVFGQSDCVGESRNMTVGQDGSFNGQCMSAGGQSVMLLCGTAADSNTSDNQAAHDYLNLICRNAVTTTTIPSSSSAVKMTNSTFSLSSLGALPAITTSTSGNFSSTSLDPPASSDSTIRMTGLTYPTPMISSQASDASESDKVVKRNGAAQWALVIVVFARSLMF